MSVSLFGSPVWLLTLAFLLAGMAFALVCVLAVRRFVPLATRERHTDLINFSVTNVAVLYGVLLAFLAVAAWESFSKASDGASVEAGLIANLYHDGQGMAPPVGRDMRGHVAQYLHHIIRDEWPMQAKGQKPPARAVPLNVLHQYVVGMKPSSGGDAVLMADMLQVLNKLDTARAARLDALSGHVPSLVWVLILGMGLLTVSLATFLPAEQLLLQTAMVGALVIAIVLVSVMILELDNPFRGAIGVSVDSFEQVASLIDGPQAGNQHEP